MSALHIIHAVAALIVLAEALNKLERTNPCAPALTRHQRIVDGLKAVAWLLLAFGAGTALLLSIFGPHSGPATTLWLTDPDPSDVAVMAGFAVLIVRTRIKEG